MTENLWLRNSTKHKILFTGGSDKKKILGSLNNHCAKYSLFLWIFIRQVTSTVQDRFMRIIHWQSGGLESQQEISYQSIGDFIISQFCIRYYFFRCADVLGGIDKSSYFRGDCGIINFKERVPFCAWEL